MQPNKNLKSNPENEGALKTIQNLAKENNFVQAIDMISNHLNDTLGSKGLSLEEKDKMILGNEFEIKKLQFKISALQRDLIERQNTELQNLNLRHEISILEDQIRQIGHQQMEDKILIQHLQSQIEKLTREKQFIVEKLQEASQELNSRTVKFLDDDQSEINRLNQKVEEIQFRNQSRYFQKDDKSATLSSNVNYSSVLSTGGGGANPNSFASSTSTEQVNKTLDQVLLRIKTTSPFSQKFAGNLEILLEIFKQSKQIISDSDRGTTNISHDKYQRALDFCSVIRHGENIKFYLKGVTQHQNMKTFEASYNLLTTIKGFEQSLLSSGALSNLLLIISLGSGVEPRHRVLTLNLLKMILQGNLDQTQFSFEIRKIDFVRIFLQELSAQELNYQILDCLFQILYEMLNFEFFPLLEQLRNLPPQILISQTKSSSNYNNNNNFNNNNNNNYNGNTTIGSVNQNLLKLVETLVLFVRDHFTNSKFSRLAPRALRLLYFLIEKTHRQSVLSAILQKNMHFELVHLVRDFVDDCEKNNQGRITATLGYALAILANFVDDSPAFVITVSAPFQRSRSCSLLVGALDARKSREMGIANLFACAWHICSKIACNSQLTQFRSTFIDAGMLEQLQDVFANYESLVFINAYDIFRELVTTQYQIKREYFNLLLNEFILAVSARYKQDVSGMKQARNDSQEVRTKDNNNNSNSKNKTSTINNNNNNNTNGLSSLTNNPLYMTGQGSDKKLVILVPILSVMRFLRDLLFNNPFTIGIFKNGNINELFELIFSFELSNMQEVEGSANISLLVESLYILLTLLQESEFRNAISKKDVPQQVLELLQLAFKRETSEEFNSVIIECLPSLFDSDGKSSFKGYWEARLQSIQFIRNIFMHYSDAVSSSTVCEPFTCTLNSISKIRTLKDHLFTSRLAVNRAFDYCYMHFMKATGEFQTIILSFIQNCIFMRTDIVMVLVKEHQNAMKMVLMGISSENRVISLLAAVIMYEIFQVIEASDFLGLSDLPVAESLRRLVVNTNQSDQQKLQIIEDIRTIYQLQFGQIFLEENN